MEQYGFTPEYMTRDGKPWFPIMGEIHYSRYPKKYWREAVEKMKAGGLDIISTYVFWLHHEEVEGEYDFTGDRDLRGFVQTVQDAGVKMILRIGPWCHGEARNGGFPDWLMKKGIKLRTNDERYLALVEQYYSKVFEQVQGFMHKDGGPIIGVQIENEYGHVGGQTGEAGEAHMAILKTMAQRIGFDVPIYTATGWGGAVTGGCLPVMGGYCEAPWDQRLTEIEPSGNYIFTKERNDHNIGSDHGFGAGITFDLDKFPFLTAELGGGLQVTAHRRPVAHSKDIGAMTLAKLGCGVNLLGYYMYHGGTNPEGKLSTLQESKATGYPNDLPELSYDFNAPIKEYGQVTETFKEIKTIAMFIQDFGSELCEMKVYLPEDNPQKPTDLSSLRTSIRRKGDRGYLFVNNYQRRYPMAEHLGTVLKAEMETQTVCFPALDIHNRDYYFFPINMPIGNTVLETATATPLCILHGAEPVYVFYTDRDPQYRFREPLTAASILTLTKEQAKNSYRVKKNGQEYLLITPGVVTQDLDGYVMYSCKNGVQESKIYCYPVPEQGTEFRIRSYKAAGQENGFLVYTKEKTPEITVQYKLLDTDEHSRTYELELTYPELYEDCFLKIDFGGERAELFLNGKKRADWFYQGNIWKVGLKKFDFPKNIQIKVQELIEDAPIFLENWPPMKKGKACEIYEVKVQTEHTYRIS